MDLSRVFRRALTPGFGLAGLVWLGVRGAVTLDLGVGRRLRPLGPIECEVAASREVVFDVIAGPYRRTPRAMADKLSVWERGGDMVLAEHLTRTGRLTTSTVETVRFERPERISFRLVRGPVPHVVETYELDGSGESTRLTYAGELGTDLWALGELWAGRVAPAWERAVFASMRAIAAEAERRAGHR